MAVGQRILSVSYQSWLNWSSRSDVGMFQWSVNNSWCCITSTRVIIDVCIFSGSNPSWNVSFEVKYPWPSPYSITVNSKHNRFYAVPTVFPTQIYYTKLLSDSFVSPIDHSCWPISLLLGFQSRSSVAGHYISILNSKLNPNMLSTLKLKRINCITLNSPTEQNILIPLRTCFR